MPPRLHRGDGEPRRLGIEIEMGGLAIPAVAAVVARVFGGEVDAYSDYEHFVRGDPAGPWAVELDFGLLKARARQRIESGEVLGAVDEIAERLLRFGAEQIVPVEVVSPPLAMPRIGEVEALVTALREAGALGTSDNALYAFGVQFNPELPDLEAATITAYLQAFLLLYDWLSREAALDLTRRITGFAEAFPRGYVAKVLAPGYAPDMTTLVDDYLAANPTRNRALDLLPLFTEIDADRVRRKVQDERVKARPTLHYRLPNCDIGQPDWSLARPWRRWLQVEHLAADPQRLEAMREAWQRFAARGLTEWLDDWADRSEQWLVDPDAR